MTTEECPMPLAVSQAGAGLCEDYGPSQGDDIIEEVGPDDAASDLSTLVVPFPELAPVVFFCLKQTTCPRNWCIRMVSSPYPLQTKIYVTVSHEVLY
ncbi:voltage-dependent T-type calcium channel subunit alpha-1I-like [Astyanax mexicanus]|uniref:Voltage-dependent T-type calcium channel subunit alpha-1I-like n=1 Tax=Astyanax mexicanus TaxID=7994 RepID=A0A8T2KWG9_ASTMX|nr:voltage-dependent T-type calcium channel subunit alpha-1I-like [Astyanax mexicanus]KAG9263880.1 voltage-dependent T-type calcium channel subunit alpha-1I-like [Astyanax mexicanus]